MGILNRTRAGERDSERAQSSSSPSLEPLESRLLLSGDAGCTQIPASLDLPLDEQALVVDLQPQDELPGTAPSLAVFLEPMPLADEGMPDDSAHGSAGNDSAGFALVIDLAANLGWNDLTLRLSDDAAVEVLDTSSSGILLSQPSEKIRSIRVLGSDDADDTLRVDMRSVLWPACSIDFVGGDGGWDSLVFQGAPNQSVNYTAVGADAGVIEVDRESDVPIRITFGGLEPVTISGLDEYTFVTNGGEDAITIDSPAPGQSRISGTSGGVAFESVTFFDVANVTIDTSANDAADGEGDSLNIDDAGGLVASGLRELTLVTGEGPDAISVAATELLPNLTIVTGNGDDEVSITAAGLKGLDLTMGDGDDTVNISGGGSLPADLLMDAGDDGEDPAPNPMQDCTISTGNGEDSIWIHATDVDGCVFATGEDGDSVGIFVTGLVQNSSITTGDGGAPIWIDAADVRNVDITTGAGDDSVSVRVAGHLENFRVTTGDGNDRVSVRAEGSSQPIVGAASAIDTGPGASDMFILGGTESDDVLDVSGTSLGSGDALVHLGCVEVLGVAGQGGNDTFHVTPSADVMIAVVGGDGYDRLTMDPQGCGVSFEYQSIIVDGMQPVGFDADIEEIIIPGVDIFPDFAVSQITVPTRASSGETIHLAWTVSNLGESAYVGPWYDCVVLSLNDQYGDDDDIELAYLQSEGALGPGDEHTEQTDVQLPAVVPGSYHIFVETDRENFVCEGVREDNNLREAGATLLIEPAPCADLETGVITIPAEVRGSNPVTITWTVTNRGIQATGDTPGDPVSDWIDRVVFSRNAIFGDADDRLAGDVPHTGVLQPGNSYTASWTGDVPGNYYIFVAADWSDLVYEHADVYANLTRSPARVYIPRRIELDTAATGSITYTGEQDEWSFYGRAGSLVTVAVNPGGSGLFASSFPYLRWAGVQILDSAGNVLATRSSATSGQMVVLENVSIPADGLYRVRVGAKAGYTTYTGNYGIAVCDVTSDVSTAVLGQERMGVIENPYDMDHWTFSAVAGQAVLFKLTGRSISGIVFDLTGPGGWTGFNDLTGDSGPIVLPVSGSYTLTARTTGQYPGSYAFCLQNLIVTDLDMGVPYAGTFVGDGQTQLFRVNVRQAGFLRINLDDSATGNRNELYASFAQAPSRGSYDYRSKSAPGADQEIVIAAPYAGTWYVLAYGDRIAAPGAFALEAMTMDVLISQVLPKGCGGTEPVVLSIFGAGFNSSTTATLISSSGVRYSPVCVDRQPPKQLTATFAAGSLPDGTYSVEVSKPGAVPDVLAEAFTVAPGGVPELVTNLIIPGSLGRHATATLYIEYANIGTASMPAPLLVLGSGDPDDSDKPLLTLDRSRLTQGFWTSAMPEGFSTSVQLLGTGITPGVLLPGESCRVPVYYAGLLQTADHWWDFSDNQVEFNLGVLTADAVQPVDWASLKESMKPAGIGTPAWDAVWAGFTSQVGSTWGDYVQMLDDNASYLGRLGNRVLDVGRLLAFELQQADSQGLSRTLSSAVDASVEEPGLSMAFSRVFSGPISERWELGTLGYGWSHNWDYLRTTASDGTVTIHGPAGSERLFQPDSRHPGCYFSQPGDHGTLTAAGGGVFHLRESDGVLYVFQGDGRLDYVQDLNGYKIDAVYTGGLLTSLAHYGPGETSPDHTLLIAYNAAGRIADVTDPYGRQTLFHYDADNQHLASVDYFDGRTVSYAYSLGQGITTEHALTQITYPGAAAGTSTHQYFAYDAQGRLSSTYRDGNAERVDFSYDSAGMVTAANAVGDVSQFYFDHRGFLVKTVDGLGNAVSMVYDDLGNLISVTDPSGRSSTYSYDAKGNMVSSVDALGNGTRFAYSSAYSRLASVTDARNNTTRYAYDSRGNLTSITYADGSFESWVYNDPDDLSDPSAWTNRRGNATPGDPNDHVVAYDYDSNGRLLSKLYSDGSRADYAYDARGNLLTVIDATGTTAFTYDANDYLIRIDYPGGQWLQFTYNAAGQRASSLDQTGHRLDYYYDAVGRLDYMENESGVREVDYNYDAAGRLVLKTLGNGVYTTYEYDRAGQLLHLINYKPDDSVLSRFDYTYDARGRRTSMTTLDGAWTYGYDDLGQLTRAVFVPGEGSTIPAQDETYVYDALGNRIRTIINGVATEYTANNMNQYVTVGGVTYVYDQDGNLIQQGDTTYTYNDENRLIEVDDGTNLWQYTYDALGNRVASTENGTTTRYIIDPIGLGNVVGEYDAVSGLVAQYDHGLGLLSGVIGSDGTIYYTFDAIGNVQHTVTTAGTVANSYVYSPFGTTNRQAETLPNPFQFIGEFGVMNEGSDSALMRGRVYAYDTGRFTSHDPIGLMGGDANWSLYAGNDPVTFIDPEGLFFIPGAAAGAVIGGVLSGGGYAVTSFLTGGLSWQSFTWRGLAGSVASGAILGAAVGGTGGAILPAIGAGTVGGAAGYSIERAGTSQFTAGGLLTTALMSGATSWIPTKMIGFKGPIWGWFHPGFRTMLLRQNATGQSLWRSLIVGVSVGTTVGAAGAWVAHSLDPNQKVGPGGFGSGGFTSGDSTLAYRIDFENEASATAPAQVVTVTDRLDTDLDWSTFELTEIGFGDQMLSVPEGLQYFETIVPVSYNGVDFEVHVEAGIRSSDGQMYANFYCIDSATSLPPAVDVGFLPPEDGTGRGMGYVGYVIRPKAGLPTGTEIVNIALIQFDFGEVIATNQVDPHDPAQGTDPAKECRNTIDAGTPSSQVVALPGTSLGATGDFLVQWTGQDDVGGSGVACYDIYVSDNGLPYVLWKDDIAETSATFTGQDGHTYAFYSVARDNVGHVEAAPPIADAETVVDINTPPRANAGGPYAVSEGGILQLNGFGSADDEQDPATLVYEWDFDGDGEYDDATGRTPVLSAGLSAGPNSAAATLRVTDDHGAVAYDTATITVHNVAPVVTISGPAELVQGDSFAGSGSFVDPGMDTWTATVDYGDGTGIQPLTLTGTAFVLDHVYLSQGTYTIAVEIADEDGSSGIATLVVTVRPVESTPVAVDDLVSTSLLSTRYDRRTRQTRIQMSIRNTSETAIFGPVWVVIRSIDVAPNVSLVGAGGTTADGYAYIDVTSLLGDGRLDPGEEIQTCLVFDNPLALRFNISYSIRGSVSLPLEPEDEE